MGAVGRRGRRGCGAAGRALALPDRSAHCVHDLQSARAEPRPDLGLWRDPFVWTGGVLRRGRLRLRDRGHQLGQHDVGAHNGCRWRRRARGTARLLHVLRPGRLDVFCRHHADGDADPASGDGHDRRPQVCRGPGPPRWLQRDDEYPVAGAGGARPRSTHARPRPIVLRRGRPASSGPRPDPRPRSGVLRSRARRDSGGRAADGAARVRSPLA